MKWKIIIIGMIIISVIAIAMLFSGINKESGGENKINLSISSLNQIIKPINIRQDGDFYTPSTEEHCVNGKCWKAIYSEIRFVYEDNQWKNRKDARSLVGSGVIPIIKDDRSFPIRIIDYNDTSITIDIQADTKEYNKDIPIRIWRINNSYYDGCEDAKTSVNDTRCSTSKEDYKLTFTNILNTTERLDLITPSKTRTYAFGEDYILEYGFNSTTIKLVTSGSQNMGDASSYFGQPNFNYGTTIALNVLNYTSTGGRHTFFKWNITAVPAGQVIEDASLNLYASSNALDATSEGFNITTHLVYDNYTILDTGLIWCEGTEDSALNTTACGITWARKPVVGYYDPTISDQKNHTFGTPINVWESYNVTSIINYAYTNGWANASIFVGAMYAWGSPTNADQFTFVSKENNSASSIYDPYLNITYTSASDTTPPTFTDIANITQDNVTAVNYDINATDASGLSAFWINDTTNFKINVSSGVFENNSALNVGYYPVNVSVNDTLNNVASQIIYVNLTALAGGNCWSYDSTNKVLYVPSGCIYYIPSGTTGYF